MENINMSLFQKISDSRGDLFVVTDDHVGFKFNRIFYFTCIEAGIKRGGHAHKAQHEYIVCLQGEFAYELFKSTQPDKGILRAGDPQGLYIPPMAWINIESTQPNSILLALCSDHYDAEDYICDFEEFLSKV